MSQIICKSCKNVEFRLIIPASLFKDLNPFLNKFTNVLDNRKRGDGYYWCHRENKPWDYCSPNLFYKVGQCNNFNCVPSESIQLEKMEMARNINIRKHKIYTHYYSKPTYDAKNNIFIFLSSIKLFDRKMFDDDEDDPRPSSPILYISQGLETGFVLFEPRIRVQDKCS